ncbi:unnamed protein product (macronuclear) [Paramecium tetraurelia]|uniref:Uncharacterized protein n=1 Tax=Paramecium tetraurelia TaxID=5888 RepID=A0EB62_PARTE|nr:uncharacterized protein GSPATT00025263001 [Paramecium tetraurelia]CAK92529.1 unnamed protein product [Paramecium tetraurelia]|eukprot:XP_001459926.1 hypothetical protein (macronuclear) [Paramecium tetraurelia strain d4-2]
MQQPLFLQIRQFILQFDMFGQPPKFRILGKYKYNSTLGALSTLGTIFFALAYLIVGIQELIAKNSPNVISSERQVVETSPFFLERNNFTIAITMADLNSQPLTTINKYFTISLKNCQTTRIYNETSQSSNVTRNCTMIPLEACTKEHFLSETQIDYFSRIRLGSVQCIQKDYWDDHPPVLQGIKTSPVYSSLTITVSVCKNSTNKSDCAPIEDIKKQLSSGFYAVHLSDSLLQMNRAVNMSLDVINIQYYTFSITTSKNIFQQFKVVDTQTDSGMVFSDLSEQQVLIQDSLRESTDLYNEEYLVLHSINLSSKYTEYQRSYVKIQAILSRVGGLYQMIFLLLSAFIQPLAQLMLDIDMANELFKFSDNKKDKLNLSDDNKVIDGLAGIVRSRRKLLSPRDTGRLNSDNNQEVMINESLNIILQKKNQISRNIKTIIWIFIGCDKKKKKMLEMAKEKYMEKLDVKLIIQKLYELDQLRDIILTEEQKKLFKYLPKPDIAQDLEQAKCLDQSKQNQQLQSIAIQEAFQAYEKVVSLGWKSGVNQKLIQSLDPEIQQLFQSLQKSQANQNQFLNEIPLNQSKVRFDVGDLEDCQSIYDDCNANPQRIYTQVPKKMNKWHETQ